MLQYSIMVQNVFFFQLNVIICFMQFEEAKSELSDLKEKYEKTEQEKQLLADELDECKANLKELQEKGTKVSAGLSITQQKG